MRKYLPLRPRLYAQEIEELLTRLPGEGAVVDLDGEAERIALRCGMSPSMALRDFQKTFWRLWEHLPPRQAYDAVQP